LYLAIAVSLFVFFFHPRLEFIHRPLLYFDALGLGTFLVIGRGDPLLHPVPFWPQRISHRRDSGHRCCRYQGHRHPQEVVPAAGESGLRFDNTLFLTYRRVRGVRRG
jgi:hypothetical protein